MNSNVDLNDDYKFMKAALQEAKNGYDEGGVPVGAVMVEDGKIIARGYNKRVQNSDPTSHGETDCFRNAGRRKNYKNITLYTTLSPCMMCAGTIVQFGISRVVVGEAKNFEGNIKFLEVHGVQVELLEDTDCIELMGEFIKEKPYLWNEDIAEE